MKKFKHLLTTIALCAAVAAGACWFGENNLSGLEDDYLAYLTGDVKHIENSTDGKHKIVNGQKVALPFTVFVKISPHHRESSDGDGRKITKAILQYKIVDKKNVVATDAKSTWITVKEIENPDWELDFDNPVALFGRDCIDIPNVTEETEIVIRLYLSDGTYQTGPLDDDIPEDIEDSIEFEYPTNNGNGDNKFTYTDGWTAPFVWKVKVLPNASKSGENNGGTTKPSRRPHR